MACAIMRLFVARFAQAMDAGHKHKMRLTGSCHWDNLCLDQQNPSDTEIVSARFPSLLRRSA
jgi:hypothetical protein